MTRVTPLNRTVHFEKTIKVLECCSCSVDFGLGTNFIAERQKDHQTFYCPNGHPQGYFGDNETEKRAKELAAEKDRLERQLRYAREDRDDQRTRRLAAERQRAAAKGQLTKTKNRIANGVCPCCNRTFVNLGKHMSGQHPDYAPGVTP